MGIIGVFLGTIISSIFVCIWIEAVILFKYGFKKKPTEYFKYYFKYTIFAIIIGIITYYICLLPKETNLFLQFVIKFIICIIIPHTFIILFFHNTEEYKYFYNMIKKLKKNKGKLEF